MSVTLTMPAADTRLRPWVALKAVRRLMRDPEDTRQVFVALKALRGQSGVKLFRRFKATPMGRQILAERRRLLDRLSDAPVLAALPDGTLGRDYAQFMRGEDLTADGLVAASMAREPAPMSPEAELFRDRMRDTHDLMHVLTGYGRDPLGELCLLAFTYAHTRNPGLLLIIALGSHRFASRARGGGRRAILEGYLRGRRCAWLPAQDWEAMLAHPTETLRRTLGIAPARRYRPFTA